MFGFDIFDRLHNRNDMRFNVFISTVVRGFFANSNARLTEQKLESVKNLCFFSDCGNALELKGLLESNHGCLHGV